MARKKQRPKKTKKSQQEKGRLPSTGQQRREAENARARAASWNQQGEAAWESGDRDKAIRLFERAASRDPSNPVYQVNLARSYGLQYDRERAAKTTARILDRFGHIGQVHYMVAESFVRFKDFESAEAHFRQALDLGLNRVDRVRTLAALARILERLHRLEEAVEVAASAVAAWPDHPKSNLIHARALRRAGQEEAAYTIYEQLADRTDVSPDVMADSWYAIADRHDRAGEYEEAFAARSRAKGAYHDFSSKSWRAAELIEQRNAGLMSSITKGHFKRWAEASGDLTPHLQRGIAWLIGHPRSGTTLLEQVLDSHSALISADELEVFASSVYPQLARETGVPQSASITTMLNHAQANHLCAARRRYLNEIQGAMQESIGYRVLMDKNPEMTLLLPVICRIFPASKILFALRDPRDVVLSCFSQALPLNSVSVHYHTIEGTAAKYARMMDSWLRLRDMIQADWIEVRYEDTVDDLETQARRSLRFLELDWEPSVLAYHERAQSKHVHSPTYEAVTKPVYRSAVGRWRNYEQQLAPVMDVLETYVREFGYDL
ncbi:sulfotransferase [Pirellulales bacterium]|nr:sulfotransferase [Pirellulales bacterium]